VDQISYTENEHMETNQVQHHLLLLLERQESEGCRQMQSTVVQALNAEFATAEKILRRISHLHPASESFLRALGAGADRGAWGERGSSVLSYTICSPCKTKFETIFDVIVSSLGVSTDLQHSLETVLSGVPLYCFRVNQDLRFSLAWGVGQTKLYPLAASSSLLHP
jgi:hypothetical protein